MNSVQTLDIDPLVQDLVDRIIRFKPESKELLPPSFLGRKGGRVPTVEAKGELAAKMAEMARNIYFENGKPPQSMRTWRTQPLCCVSDAFSE